MSSSWSRAGYWVGTATFDLDFGGPIGGRLLLDLSYLRKTFDIFSRWGRLGKFLLSFTPSLASIGGCFISKPLYH